MSKANGLPSGVIEKSGSYYLVKAQGAKRIWIKLSRVKHGLPEMFRALARAMERPGDPHLLPAVIADWEKRVMPKHADTTQRDERRYNAMIAEAFPDAKASEITPVHAVTFLEQFDDKPRTYNAVRGQFYQLMRFAEKWGHRPAGSNPIAPIETMRVKARDRYITDSEVRRIKVAAIRCVDRHGNPSVTRSGYMLCALIDVAILTGQRIGDLLSLEWSQITDSGISFQQSKTNAKVLVEMSPKLLNTVERLKALRKERRAFTARVFTTQDGRAYTYGGVQAAWRRALARAKLTKSDTHFHDLRAKAATDSEQLNDLKHARRLLGHTTEQQTAGYIRNKRAQKAKPSR